MYVYCTISFQVVWGLLDLSNHFNKLDKSVKFGPKQFKHTTNIDYPHKFSCHLKEKNKF